MKPCVLTATMLISVALGACCAKKPASKVDPPPVASNPSADRPRFDLLAFLTNTDLLSLTVDNQTDQPVTGSMVADVDGKAVLSLPTVPPHQSLSAKCHFGRDLGPSQFRASQGDRKINGRLLFLLSDDGPIDFVLTITPAGVNFKGDKGDGVSYNGPLQPI